MPVAITNIFVLMLENAAPTPRAESRQSSEASPEPSPNSYAGRSYPVIRPAAESMPVDPGHEFLDVLAELCGSNAAHAPGGAYPTIDNSGFVTDYASSHAPDEGNAPNNFGEIMKCFASEQLPVLTLARAKFRGVRRLARLDSGSDPA